MNYFETIKQENKYTNINGKEDVQSNFYRINNDKTQIQKNVNGNKLSMTFNTGDILNMMNRKNQQVCLNKLLSELKDSDSDSDSDSDYDSDSDSDIYDDEILYKQPVKKIKKKLPTKYSGKTRRDKKTRDNKQTKKNKKIKLKPIKEKRNIKIKTAKKDKR